jgi:hypothetical protein
VAVNILTDLLLERNRSRKLDFRFTEFSEVRHNLPSGCHWLSCVVAREDSYRGGDTMTIVDVIDSAGEQRSLAPLREGERTWLRFLEVTARASLAALWTLHL